MNLIKDILGARRVARVRPPVQTVARVAVNMRPMFRAWGGGNQWLLQMVRYLNYTGYEVSYDLHREVDAIIINHGGLTGKLSFGVEEIAAYKKRFPRVRVLHRINDNDIRKKTQEMDARLARFDAVADFTVFISEWLRDHHAEKWFDRAKPHGVILNGADPSVFHPVGSSIWREGEPLRFVTHHWSDNWMKGFTHYRELDERIAAGEFPQTELWVIGRWPAEIQWKSARTFRAAHGSALADQLRQCHVYLTASLHEPGGMHFIEGLQCGQPVVYHEDGGGIVELARPYGIGFREDLPAAIHAIRARYSEFRRKVLAAPPSGDRMTIAFREILQRLLAERA